MYKTTPTNTKRHSNFVFFSVVLLFISLVVISLNNIAIAQTRVPAEVELVGVSLAKATRAELRSALNKQKIPAIREEDRYWYDEYKAASLLDEADQLLVGYVDATGKFAEAIYRLPSSIDTAQVQRAISLVSLKYGNPQSSSGSISLGNVKATWQRGPIQIIVERGWPNTTTRIYLRHTANYAAMQAELARQDDENKRKAAEKQSRAF